MELVGRKVLVVGLEKSGIASANFLLREGAKVTVSDQKPLENLNEAARELLGCGVAFLPQTDGGFDGFDLIVVSPGVPADIKELEAARLKGVRVIGEVELASSRLKGYRIGITGSNGKTTTTALTGHILADAGIPVQVGGNIGTPVTAMAEGSRPGEWNVLELSSFQLETVESFCTDIAVILNITQNHLDRHYTMDRYADAKGKILDAQSAKDWAVLNEEDYYCQKFRHRGNAQRMWFSSREGSKADLTLESGEIRFCGKSVITTEEVPIRGRHNIENTMAAIGATQLAGLSLNAIASGIRTFRAVEHRLEFVRTVNNVSFYNDSKATSVDAALKALDAFDGGLWVILGGKDKGSDYKPLRDPLHAKAHAALLIGSAAEKITGDLVGAVDVIQSGTLQEAVARAFRDAKPGDTILLAPACASFDQFQSYEHRGRIFKELVNALESKRNGTKA